jgi:NAD(P)-dependent dehydrogenase (short-subunit alcohol dehydrogenase family)
VVDLWLSQRKAIVTGGVRGIGRSIAEMLTDYGAKVAVIDIDCHLVGERGKQFFYSADISQEQDVNRAFDAIIAEFGSIDILVNNAGINIIRPAEQFSISDWNRVLAINLTGQFICAQRAGREMIQRGRGGRIINISSVAGHIAPMMHTAVAYSAAKAGVLGMTRALAVEWAKHGILVNAVCPGMTETELTRERLNQPAYLEQIMARVPMKQNCGPEDIAGAVLFLASPLSSKMTGHSLNVDGGWLAA